eukprot:TCONS_00020286-protein
MAEYNDCLDKQRVKEPGIILGNEGPNEDSHDIKLGNDEDYNESQGSTENEGPSHYNNIIHHKDKAVSVSCQNSEDLSKNRILTTPPISDSESMIEDQNLSTDDNDSKTIISENLTQSLSNDCQDSKTSLNGSPSIDTDDADTPQNVCRICYGNDEEEQLVAPCKCLGTVQYMHESCLLTWLKSGATHCELCKTNYNFKRILKPYSERKWPNVRSWHIGWIVKELVLLDWFHFLETVLCCITLMLINRMASYDLVYQFALIALFELFYYGLNIWSCFYLLFYTRWSALNLEVHVLNYNCDEDQTSYRKFSDFLISGLESYTSLLRKNRRLRMVVNSIEEHDFAA